jgi:hypothetical protein
LRRILVIFGKALVGGLVLMFVGLVVLLGLSWWGSRIPPRPANISKDGVFLESVLVPFKFSTQGDWADCWEDPVTKVDRCRRTDEHGAVKFEEFFVVRWGICGFRGQFNNRCGTDRKFDYGSAYYLPA